MQHGLHLRSSRKLPRLLLSLSLFTPVIALCQGAATPPASTLEQWYGASIYCVWVQPANPEPGFEPNRLPHGTAFLVHAGGYFLTANHVIKATGTGKIIRGKTGSCDKASASTLFTVVKTDEQTDLALLKIMELPPGAPNWSVVVMLPAALDTSKDQLLVTFGYPPPEDGGVSAITKAEGKVSNYLAPGAKFRFNAPVTKGFSGGPVFGKDGHVVGITIDGRDDVEGFKGYVPSNFARTFLLMLGYAL